MSIPSKFNTATARPVRVIFLEDDHALRQGLSDFLSLNSISVVDVASVASFRKAISEQDFDIALIDLGLPDGSGFDVVRGLQGAGLGLIIITARNGRDDRLNGYENGADLFLTKPIDGSELVLAIRNLARRVKNIEPVQSAVIAVHAWRLDQAGHRLFAPSGTMIKLSGREAAMITCLAQAAGEVVSRHELTAALGYEETNAESRRVDAVLRRLRQKAREADMELPVHAVHALGFRFSARLSLS